ncbi:TetR/AcrR family transcriptional regulator [Nocardia donostiensis]|uniref:TetR family transcriptional regulator n=1 Tax=Nocardia donostiensis TaxID=1538463 RepID=A0A1W0B7J5_9NOCA|nr:TetR family transcriptional regulator [Nocardia donostiensis]ONM46926.1 TetR family transcriptional regulator [Nocardia donostiensis]OQS13275.1 TetR family transcriptional regulator [Nocardia donostiensis]OQS18366.1 TetR family transcriptional regulator [Nocardia donostiensis]
MPTKRELILDAAIELLGSRGPRALTHRAVDETAGMPPGSTSNYTRTRTALLSAVAERLEEHDYADWALLSRFPRPTTRAQLVDGMARYVVHAVTTDRARTLARYALVLEAGNTPAAHESVLRGHMRLIAWSGELLAGLGGDETATTALVDYLDGVIMHQLLIRREPDFDPRPMLDRIVSSALDGRDG